MFEPAMVLRGIWRQLPFIVMKFLSLQPIVVHLFLNEK